MRSFDELHHCNKICAGFFSIQNLDIVPTFNKHENINTASMYVQQT